jgi:hypothetical protein
MIEVETIAEIIEIAKKYPYETVILKSQKNGVGQKDKETPGRHTVLKLHQRKRWLEV